MLARSKLTQLVAALSLFLPAIFSIASADGPPPTATLSLEGAIAEGLHNSPEIQRGEAAVDESHWKTNETFGAGFLPKVSVGASYYFDFTKYQLTNLVFNGAEVTIPGIFPNKAITVAGTVPIFDGLASIYRSQSASLAESASEQDLDRSRFVLTEQIRLAFYRSLAAAGLKDVAAENVKTLEDHLKQVGIQRAGGTATQVDALRVEVQLNEARSELDDAQDTLLEARRRLVELMGLSQDDRRLEGALPVPDANNVKDVRLEEQVPASRTDIRALELRAEAAEKERKAQASWLIPSLSAGGQFSYYNLLLYNGQVVDNHNFQTAYSLGLFLTWNIFDGGVSYARARQDEARKVQAEKAVEQARIPVSNDFAYWKRRYISNTDHFTSKQLNVKRSLESVRLAREEERAGTRTSSEVLDAELDLYRSKAGEVNAQVNALESLINLELVLGRTI
jgi:outer membrane protein TolC